jgi:hypothetical protein
MDNDRDGEDCQGVKKTGIQKFHTIATPKRALGVKYTLIVLIE